MERSIRVQSTKRWNIMRHDRDINPVTGEEEQVPQCILVSDCRPSDEQLNLLRDQYNAPEIWVERKGAFH